MKTGKQKIVMGLSGGMDSATLLGLLLHQGYEVFCCSFMYGSKHMTYELNAAKNIIDFYRNLGNDVAHYLIDLRQAFQGIESALMQTGEAIPEGHYNDETMKKTVVPGRNLIFASIMAGIAESKGAEAIALGVHSGDHHIYPDCRPEFINSLRLVLLQSSEGKVQVLSPFLNETKGSILKLNSDLILKVPYQLTRTCYKDQEYACGKCGSCRERLEAFFENNMIDPIIYEEDERFRV